MEITRLNAVGSTMHGEELGRQGGGRLFYLRPERALVRGLPTAMGRGNDYLVFQPSIYFSRTLGGRVLRLNEALSEVRGQGAELIPSVGVARLQAHYQEPERIIEAARDRLGALIEYCHKGAIGRFREALEDMGLVPPAAAGTPEGPDVRVDAETLQRCFGGLEDGLAQLGRDVDGTIACCRREVASAEWKRPCKAQCRRSAVVAA